MINEADRLERDVTMVNTTNFQTPSDTGEIPAFFTVDEKEELAVRLITRASTVNSSEGPGAPMCGARERGSSECPASRCRGRAMGGCGWIRETGDHDRDRGRGFSDWFGRWGAPPSTRVAIIWSFVLGCCDCDHLRVWVIFIIYLKHHHKMEKEQIIAWVFILYSLHFHVRY